MVEIVRILHKIVQPGAAAAVHRCVLGACMFDGTEVHRQRGIIQNRVVLLVKNIRLYLRGHRYGDVCTRIDIVRKRNRKKVFRPRDDM